MNIDIDIAIDNIFPSTLVYPNWLPDKTHASQ